VAAESSRRAVHRGPLENCAVQGNPSFDPSSMDRVWVGTGADLKLKALTTAQELAAEWNSATWLRGRPFSKRSQPYHGRLGDARGSLGRGCTLLNAPRWGLCFFRFQVTKQAFERLLVRVVVLPVAEVRDEVFAHVGGEVIGVVPTLPFLKSLVTN
jgi:hypothetical protein